MKSRYQSVSVNFIEFHGVQCFTMFYKHSTRRNITTSRHPGAPRTRDPVKGTTQRRICRRLCTASLRKEGMLQTLRVNFLGEVSRPGTLFTGFQLGCISSSFHAGHCLHTTPHSLAAFTTGEARDSKTSQVTKN